MYIQHITVRSTESKQIACHNPLFIHGAGGCSRSQPHRHTFARHSKGQQDDACAMSHRYSYLLLSLALVTSLATRFSSVPPSIAFKTKHTIYHCFVSGHLRQMSPLKLEGCGFVLVQMMPGFQATDNSFFVRFGGGRLVWT